MNVTARNWQVEGRSAYKSAVSGKGTEKTDQTKKETASSDVKENSLISFRDKDGCAAGVGKSHKSLGEFKDVSLCV